MEKIIFSSWESIWSIFLLGLLTYISLILIVRVSGKRTLSQMREFDFIVTVALGSVLATVLLSSDVALSDGVVALIVLISMQYLLAFLSVRSSKFSRLISAEPTLIFYKGDFVHTALRKERVTVDEVLSILRSSGVASIDQVEAVVMEANGQFSVVEQRKSTNEHFSLVNVRKPEKDLTERIK